MNTVIPFHDPASPLDLQGLARRVQTHLAFGASAVILDLTGVREFGARGMRALLEALKATAAYEVPLVLSGVSEQADLWLSVTGAKALCGIAPDVETAIRQFAPPRPGALAA